jgi:hypothetical protein
MKKRKKPKVKKTNSAPAKPPSQIQQSQPLLQWQPRPLPLPQPQFLPPEPQLREPTHRRMGKWVKWVVGTPLAVVAFGLTVVINVWGPPWPTEPVFAPGQPSAGSPLDVPFTVTNKSALFAITSLQITCIAVQIDTGPPYFKFKDIGFAVLGSSTLEVTKSGPQTCAFNSTVILDPNSKLLAAQIKFASRYESPWPWEKAKTKTVESDIFTLNTKTSPPQWMQGKPL